MNLHILLKAHGLLIATHNKGKLKEIQELLAPMGIHCISAGELGMSEPEETADSFQGNAELKAKAAAAAANMPALSDDSGLVVPALKGAPGIYSARWAGEKKDFNAAFERIKHELMEAGAPLHSPAYFICALSLAIPPSLLVPPVYGGVRGGTKRGFFGQFKESTRLLSSMNIAKHLRNRMTDAEWKFWEYASGSKLEGHKFRRQQSIGSYIVDFVCMQQKLIVEIDGSQHMNSKRDAERTQNLESLGYRVLRFWNNDVLQNIEGVVETVLVALREVSPPSPPQAGGINKELLPPLAGGYRGECNITSLTFIGRVDGHLTFPPRGANGFGYDPIFIKNGMDKTFAEITAEDKHAISHRADAFRQFLQRIRE